MKAMPDLLHELAENNAKFQNATAAAMKANRAALEERRTDIEAALKMSVDDLESIVRDITSASRAWWDATKDALAHQVAETKAELAEHQHEAEAERARRTAEDAAEDAAAAVALATSCMNFAEIKVIDAALARMNAADFGEDPATAS
ncbi:MAG TPA: hypothetical protein VHC63_05895 [Acidimicrobiales bacterium]|nr:hypothetical protein [Acidimicrobiales bacterium]